MMEEIDDVGFEESMIVCGTCIKFSNLKKKEKKTSQISASGCYLHDETTHWDRK